MDTPSGGKVIVFGGDFRQVLPVIKRGKIEDVVAATLNSSYLWDHVTVLRLTVNIGLTSVSSATPYDQDQINVEKIRTFVDWLLNIGNGNVNPTQDDISEIQMPDNALVKDVDDPIGSIISSIYPD
ncbi:uncharacterized protein [Rutidosis leptorrhynchoides]|uniref:uncharacterized protein n=1 Tax=Rutidosis leptorrhynchoides TaxID=125765 RepID=UPI003A99746A